MKQLLVISLFICFGCQILRAQSIDFTTINVEVKNQTSDSLEIQRLDYITAGSIKIDSDGIGSISLNLKQGVYYSGQTHHKLSIFNRLGVA